MDEIRVALPRERGFGAVAGLVVGGVAARHDLTLDVLDDLQLAFETLLEHEDSEEEITIALRIDEGTVEADVGPFSAASIVELQAEVGETLGLRRLLDTVVDEVSLEERADGTWVGLRKTFATAAEPA